MIKKISIIFLFLLLSIPAYAQKIPIKITPTQIISTNHDEIELGDWVKFETVNDIYVNGDLYIRKNTPIFGFVGFIHDNGWAGDNAEIWFKKFSMTDVNNKNIIVDYPLKIKGTGETSNLFKEFLAYFTLRLIRGSEIFIEPDTKVYNIFIEK